MKFYTLGFVFQHLKTEACGIMHDDYQVLLLLKKKPESQAGMYNGIGGGKEWNETSEQCIAREAKEEAGLDILPESWNSIGVMSKVGQWTIEVFYTFANKLEVDRIPEECDEGSFMWCWHDELPENVMPNLRWMIPFALNNHTFEPEGAQRFSVTY